METSWQSETDSLACRWTEAGEHVRYDRPWVRADTVYTAAAHPAASFFEDMASRSVFGGRDWYVLEPSVRR